MDEEVLEDGQGFKEDTDTEDDLLEPMGGGDDFKFEEEYEDKDPDRDH
ncbi:MAG: hypothetical protein AAB945_01160 [Patescibacteria group bacterium]